MKTKTINKVINAKFDEWMASITDEDVREKLKKGCILTGGSIASMLLRQPVNDFDFYFKDFETTKTAADYYVKKFLENPPPSFKKGGENISMYVDVTEPALADREDAEKAANMRRVRIHIKSAGVAGASGENPYEYFEGRAPEVADEYIDKVLEAKQEKDSKPDYRPVFLTDNAISLNGDIQMVIRFYGTPDQIHENYDFVHATNYWTSWDRKVVLEVEALECLLTKELRYVGSKYPICSLVRARKFIQRDWTINAGQFLKMSMQISELDLKNYEVLKEQLCGMDVAYFQEVLYLLKAKDPTKINAAYLTEIIDRIFG